MINEYPKYDLMSEIPKILAKTRYMFGLTWNSGLAYTYTAYRQAERSYKQYMDNPEVYLKIPKKRKTGDPNHPGNLLPLLRNF